VGNITTRFDFQLYDRWGQPLYSDNTTYIVASVTNVNRSTLTGAISAQFMKGRATFETLGLLALVGFQLTLPHISISY
jgi:hypothetical protein